VNIIPVKIWVNVRVKVQFRVSFRVILVVGLGYVVLLSRAIVEGFDINVSCHLFIYGLIYGFR
jgi:hypothetical protein